MRKTGFKVDELKKNTFNQVIDRQLSNMRRKNVQPFSDPYNFSCTNFSKNFQPKNTTFGVLTRAFLYVILECSIQSFILFEAKTKNVLGKKQN